jgi:VanZ like family
MKPWILYLIAGLITYGSLYPFNFSMPASHSTAWETLFYGGSLWSSRMDMFDNLLLFIPFGFVGILSVAIKRNLATRLTLIALMGFVLALSVQIAQIYVPSRTPALADVFWNMIGIGIGVITGLSIRLSSNRLQAGNALPLSVIALWLAAELLPFVPSLDVQSLRTNLKGILQSTLAFDQLLFHAAGILVTGRALAAIVGETDARRWLPVLACAVAAGKVLVVTLTLNISILMGLAIGCVTWWWLSSWREPKRATAIMLALFAAYAYSALMPFEFRGSAEPFSLIPFAGLLRGSMLANVQTLTANLCLYAGILWLVKILGGRLIPSSIGLAVCVLIFEIIQIYAIGRTPEITDPLLVLLLGQIFQALPQSASKPQRAGTSLHIQSTANASGNARATSASSHVLLPHKGFNFALWGACAGTICLLMAFVFYRILRLPQLPYNVVDLFLGNGAFPFLIIFSLALLWIGASARLVSHYVAVSKHPWLALPLLAFGAGVIMLLLLFSSVTEESIADIAGSNNLHWFVINKEIWGAWARSLFTLLPAGVVSFFERPVRFAALYGPLVTFLALMFMMVKTPNQVRHRVSSKSLLLLSTILWLWLCKGIAFDWSSTDNLNELIERDGPAGWGGGGYLYLLVALICANAVLLSHIRLTIIWLGLAVGATLAAVPVGWWLLNNGLDQYVQKYELVFSGVQFLLGPDRKQTLSQDVLFLRWSIVQLAGVIVIATGARIIQPVIDRLSESKRPKTETPLRQRRN